MGRDAVSQDQTQGTQPSQFGPAKGGHVLETFGPGEHGTQGDGQQIAQQMGGVPGITRIGTAAKWWWMSRRWQVGIGIPPGRTVFPTGYRKDDAKKTSPRAGGRRGQFPGFRPRF